MSLASSEALRTGVNEMGKIPILLEPERRREARWGRGADQEVCVCGGIQMGWEKKGLLEGVTVEQRPK